MSWRDLARCRTDRDLLPAEYQANPVSFFFPQGPGDTASRRALIAEFCEPCPVRDQCAAAASEHFTTDGWWGGRSQSQRRASKRQPERLPAKQLYDLVIRPGQQTPEGAVNTLAAVFGVSRRCIYRWQAQGLNLVAATEACHRIGLTPDQVWGADFWREKAS